MGDAVGAGPDCVEAMRRRKAGEYGPHLEELAEQGVLYRPLCFSTHGRLHPDATAILTNVAKRAARRRGPRASWKKDAEAFELGDGQSGAESLP